MRIVFSDTILFTDGFDPYAEIRNIFLSVTSLGINRILIAAVTFFVFPYLPFMIEMTGLGNGFQGLIIGCLLPCQCVTALTDVMEGSPQLCGRCRGAPRFRSTQSDAALR